MTRGQWNTIYKTYERLLMTTDYLSKFSEEDIELFKEGYNTLLAEKERMDKNSKRSAQIIAERRKIDKNYGRENKKKEKAKGVK